MFEEGSVIRLLEEERYSGLIALNTLTIREGLKNIRRKAKTLIEKEVSLY